MLQNFLSVCSTFFLIVQLPMQIDIDKGFVFAKWDCSKTGHFGQKKQESVPNKRYRLLFLFLMIESDVIQCGLVALDHFIQRDGDIAEDKVLVRSGFTDLSKGKSFKDLCEFRNIFFCTGDNKTGIRF